MTPFLPTLHRHFYQMLREIMHISHSARFRSMRYLSPLYLIEAIDHAILPILQPLFGLFVRCVFRGHNSRSSVNTGSNPKS
ncbi:MAG: hypothetical protein PHX60_07215 [Giesbergeria sp.]|uniref:hypothetical protein n=1 Tax=Giesbergeria sp. TaxID=2818473 RepID=UPI00262A874D|nr:hypothetical protein [Giesbergeria sp.]MDD2609476.1 hypothetical protein [Giesbergeria sp.]